MLAEGFGAFALLTNPATHQNVTTGAPRGSPKELHHVVSLVSGVEQALKEAGAREGTRRTVKKGKYAERLGPEEDGNVQFSSSTHGTVRTLR
jgi:hypothetical protein